MSKEKEALERLLDDYEYLMERYYPIRDIRNQQINKTRNDVEQIKQALDHLETLEQEHANALQVIKILTDENKAQEMKKKVGWF